MIDPENIKSERDFIDYNEINQRMNNTNQNKF